MMAGDNDIKHRSERGHTLEHRILTLESGFRNRNELLGRLGP